MSARALLLLLAGLTPLASIRMFLYRRVRGFDLARGAEIGPLNWLDADELVMGERSRIRGVGNVFLSVHRVEVGEHAAIGGPRFGLNLFRGTRNKPSYPRARFRLGRCSHVELMHYFDLCADITIGDNVVVGGIKSVFFTHTFHKSEFLPIRIGDECYIGSNCLFQMGAEVPRRSVVGMGSVVTKPVLGDNCFIAGVPARMVEERCGYSARDAFRLRHLRFWEPEALAASAPSTADAAETERLDAPLTD